MMIEARYERALDENLVRHLRGDGQLAFLLHDIPEPSGEPYALDLQLREKNKVMYYRGTTRVLVITLRPHGDQLPSFTVTADKHYAQDKSCADAFGQLKTLGETAPAEAPASFRDYLSSATKIAPRGHYDNHAEGYWQNRICHRYGRGCRPEDPWLVLDRECVIGFKNVDHKNAALGPILHRYHGTCDDIGKAGSDKWRFTHQNKGLGDELDMLAVDKDGHLLAIELKYRTNASRIYWGPVQVGVYRDAFAQLLGTLGPRIVKLVRQKVTLGLLPQHALGRLPADGFGSVCPVLAVANANPKSGCWSKLTEVMEHAGRVDVVTIGTKKTGHVELPGIESSHLTVDD